MDIVLVSISSKTSFKFGAFSLLAPSSYGSQFGLCEKVFSIDLLDMKRRIFRLNNKNYNGSLNIKLLNSGG